MEHFDDTKCTGSNISAERWHEGFVLSCHLTDSSYPLRHRSNGHISPGGAQCRPSRGQRTGAGRQRRAPLGMAPVERQRGVDLTEDDAHSRDAAHRLPRGRRHSRGDGALPLQRTHPASGPSRCAPLGERCSHEQWQKGARTVGEVAPEIDSLLPAHFEMKYVPVYQHF